MFKREIGQGGLMFMASMGIREDVFHTEQGIDKAMMSDDKDKEAYHCVIYDFGMPIGCGRLYKDNEGFHIGRVAINKKYRGKGLGKDIVRGLMEKAWEVGADKISIHAQKSVISFYEELGFIGKGDLFLEANILHLSMEVVKK